MSYKAKFLIMILLGTLALVPVISVPAVRASAPYSLTSTVVRSDGNTEAAIAIDPSNNSYIAVNVVQSNEFAPYSTDGGSSWRIPQTRGNNWPSAGGGGDPWIAVGPTGVFYGTTHYQGSVGSPGYNLRLVLYMASSSNHGATWDFNPSFFVSANSTVGLTNWTFLNGTSTQSCYTESFSTAGDYEKIAVDSGPSSSFRGYIYIVGDFNVLQNGYCIVQNGFVRSRDGGNTWDLHVITNPTFAGASEVEKLSIGPNGEIYFLRRYYTPGVGEGLLFEKSTDAGNSWTYQTISVPNLLVYASLAVSSSGTLYVTYFSCLTVCNSTQTGSEAVNLISSTDDGNTWSPPTVISDANALPLWTVDLYEDCTVPSPFTDCYPEHKPPTIMATPLGVAVAWTDWRNSNNNTIGDVYAYVPSLSTSNIRLTTSPGRLCPASHSNKVCTWFGSDFIDSTYSSQGLYFVYGVDLDGSGGSDTVVTRISQEFSISESPSSWIFPVGSKRQTNITVSSFGVREMTVNLVATASSGTLSCWFTTQTNVASLLVPVGGTVSEYLTCASAIEGTYTVDITGTSGSVSHSLTLSTTISGFSITGPSSVSFPTGSSVNVVSLTSLFGYSGTVYLVFTAPAAVTVSCPASVNLTPNATMGPLCSLTSTSPGQYAVNILGYITCTSNCFYQTVSHSHGVVVNVGDFSISLNPSTSTIQKGSTVTSTVSLVSLYGFSGSVTLSNSLSPQKAHMPTVSLSPLTITLTPNGSGTAVLTFRTTMTTTKATYVVTVTAQSGSIAHTATFTVSVT